MNTFLQSHYMGHVTQSRWSSTPSSRPSIWELDLNIVRFTFVQDGLHIYTQSPWSHSAASTPGSRPSIQELDLNIVKFTFVQDGLHIYT